MSSLPAKRARGGHLTQINVAVDDVCRNGPQSPALKRNVLQDTTNSPRSQKAQKPIAPKSSQKSGIPKPPTTPAQLKRRPSSLLSTNSRSGSFPGSGLQAPSPSKSPWRTNPLARSGNIAFTDIAGLNGRTSVGTRNRQTVSHQITLHHETQPDSPEEEAHSATEHTTSEHPTTVPGSKGRLMTYLREGCTSRSSLSSSSSQSTATPEHIRLEATDMGTLPAISDSPLLALSAEKQEAVLNTDDFPAISDSPLLSPNSLLRELTTSHKKRRTRRRAPPTPEPPSAAAMLDYLNSSQTCIHGTKEKTSRKISFCPGDIVVEDPSGGASSFMCPTTRALFASSDELPPISDSPLLSPIFTAENGGEGVGSPMTSLPPISDSPIMSPVTWKNVLSHSKKKAPQSVERRTSTLETPTARAAQERLTELSRRISSTPSLARKLHADSSFHNAQ